MCIFHHGRGDVVPRGRPPANGREGQKFEINQHTAPAFTRESRAPDLTLYSAQTLKLGRVLGRAFSYYLEHQYMCAHDIEAIHDDPVLRMHGEVDTGFLC